MSELLSPKELSLISSAADDAKVDEERKEREKKAKQKQELQDAFMSQDLHPEVRDRINKAVRRAAEQGHNQIQVLAFPASYCNDHGAGSIRSTLMARLAGGIREARLRLLRA